MGSNSNIIEVGTSVKTAPLKEGMGTAADIVQSSTAKMGGYFSGLAQSTRESMAKMGASVAEASKVVTVETEHMRERFALTAEGARFSAFTVGSAFGGLGALLGASLIFEFFDKMKEGEIELSHLAEASGITVGRLTALQASMQESGSRTDNFGRQLTVLTKHMLAAAEGNEQAQESFRLLGVDTKGWADQMPPADAVLMQMAEHLHGSTKSTQDLAAASMLLGRGSLQTVAWLKQGSEAIEEQARQNKTLADSAQAAADQAKALQKQEAELSHTLHAQLLPVFSMAVTGIDLIVGGLIKLEAAGEIAFRQLEAGVMAIGSALLNVGKMFMDAQTLNWTAFKQHGMEALNGLTDHMAVAALDEEEIWDKANQKVDALFERTSENQSERDTANVTLAGKAAKTRLDQWKDELDQKAIAANKYHVLSNAEELKFWTDKLAIASVKGGEMAAVHAQIRAVEKKIGSDALQEYLAEQNDKLAVLDKADQQKVVIERQTAAELALIYGEDSAQYQRQLAKIDALIREQAAERLRLEKQHQAEMQKIAATRDESDKAHAQAAKALILDRVDFELRENLISAKEAEKINRDALDLEYKDELAALQQKLVLYKTDSLNKEKTIAEIKKVEDKYRLDSQKLDEVTTARKIALYTNAFNSINSTLRSSVTGIIQGTTTIGQAFGNLFSNLLASEGEYLAEIGLKRAERALLDLIFHTQTEAQKTTVTTAADTARMASGATANFSLAMGDAAVAGAGAYAATAVIPFVGPELAPAAAETAYWGAASFAPLTMFERGGMVPQTGPAYLHKGEAVLPQHIAKPLEAAASRGTLGGGSSIHLVTNNTINAMDGESVQRTLEANGDVVGQIMVQQLKKAHKNGVFAGAF